MKEDARRRALRDGRVSACCLFRVIHVATCSMLYATTWLSGHYLLQDPREID
jgi:hypothetical protein